MNNTPESSTEALQQELKALQKQSKEREDALKASNQQLEATNQQLQATEQQLKASNQQLEANNQQLQATEQQLRLTNQQLEETSSLAHVGGWEIDLKGNTLSWTSETYNIHELPKGKLPSVTDAISFYHPNDQKMVSDLIENAKQKGLKFDFEARIITAKNNLRWVRAIGKVLKQGDEIVGIQGVIQDITSKKETEEELRKNKNRLDYALKDVNMGAWELDLQSLDSWRSSMHDKIFGYYEPLEEWTYETSLKHVIPEDRDFVSEKYSSALTTRTELNFECRIKRADGEIRWIWIKGQEDFSNERGVGKMFGVIQDITERKESETAIIESEAKFRSITEQNIMGVCILQDNIVKYVNEALADMYGYTVEEVLAWEPGEFFKIFTPETLQIAQEQAKKKQAGDKDQLIHYTVHGIKKSGKLLWADNYSRTMVYDGRPANLITQVDITERIKAEKVIQEKAKEFEFQNTELTKSQSRLSKAERIGQIGNWSNNLITGEVQWSQGMFRIFGLDINKESITYAEIVEAIYEDDRHKQEAYFQQMQALKPEQTLDSIEYRIVRPNGEIRWIHIDFESEFQNDKAVSFFGTARDITYIKNAESRLKDSEAKYRSLYENAPLSYQSLDIDGNFIDVNPTWLSTLGYEREEVIGENYGDFLHPDWKSQFEKNFPAFKKRGYVSDVEFKIRHKNGSYRYISFEGCIGTHPDGSFKQTYCVFKDITEQKYAEEELENQNDTLIKLNKFSQDLTLSTVDDKTEELITKGIKEITDAEFTTFSEYNPDERSMSTKHVELNSSLLKKVTGLLGKKISKIKSYVDDNIYNEMTKDIIGYRRSLNEMTFGAVPLPIGKAIESFLQVDHFIGISFMVEGELCGTSILGIKKGKADLQRKLLENLAFTIAVSLRRRNAEIELLKAKEKAEEKETQLRNLTNNFANGMVYQVRTGKNSERKFTYISEAVNKLYGCTPLEAEENANLVYGKIHPEDLPRLIEQENDAILTKSPFHAEARAYTPSGEIRWVYYVSRPRMIDGNMYWDGLEVDITERKQLELELLSSKEKAEESDRLKSAFLANMSHEIRTPMNGILGFTGLLKNPNLSGEKMDQYIKIIEKSGHRMLNTINDIVDISRIEAGQVEVQKSEVSINSTLKELFDFFSNETNAKGLKLIYTPTLTARESSIITDQHKLEGILTNLIKNAIKYTEQGTISLECHANAKENTINFYVKDTGIGIAPDRLEAIFNRFEQADIEDSRALQGSGLGLAISKSYVEMLGGTISVSSEEGVGSVFTFNLPAYNDLENPEFEASEKVESQISLSNMTMLIAEDDTTSQVYLSALLDEKLKGIILAENGLSAIQELQNHPEVDVILMDIKMPGLNGYETTREIRKFNTDIIIIAQTAFGLSGDRQKALDAGCDEYIAKPIAEGDLLEKIRTCIDKKGSRYQKNRL